MRLARGLGTLTLVMTVGACSFVQDTSDIVLRREKGAVARPAPVSRMGEGWTRAWPGLWPAIEACIAAAGSDVQRVSNVIPAGGGAAGIRLQMYSGGRADCVANMDTAEVASVTPYTGADLQPGEGQHVLRTRSQGRILGACYVTEDAVLADGTVVGQIGHSIC